MRSTLKSATVPWPMAAVNQSGVEVGGAFDEAVCSGCHETKVAVGHITLLTGVKNCGGRWIR